MLVGIMLLYSQMIQATGEMLVWSVISFVLLLAGIGALAWYYAIQKHHESEEEFPKTDPLLAMNPTPSMKETLKYFWVVAALWLVQVLLGAVTAHYHGMWYARSAEFMSRDIVHTFVWLRVIGDTIFALGALALVWFIIGLKTCWSLSNERLDYALKR